jgi:hypothetical protein
MVAFVLTMPSLYNTSAFCVEVWSDKSDKEERREDGVLPMRVALTTFYKGKTCSKLGMLTIGMLGSRKHPSFKGQASECRHLIPFAVEQLILHAGSWGDDGNLLLQAGQSLSRYYSILTMHQRRFHVQATCAM